MQKEKIRTLSYLKIFILICLVVVILGMLFHLFVSYQNRAFTGNSFNILIMSDKYVGVVGIDDNEKRLSAVAVTDNLSEVKKENIMLQSVNFGIPIDSYIVFPKGNVPNNPDKNFFSFENIRDINTNMKIKTKNISFFDWIKLFFIVKEINSENITIKTYKKLSDLQAIFPNEKTEFFRDSLLNNEKMSMQIINGTRINGLGGRIGEMYSRFGFNVVSITADDNIEDSKIYYSDEKYLPEAETIQESFYFPIEQSDIYKVSAITLVIGEDSELQLESITE